MTIRQTVTKKTDLLTFGKYRGKSVRWILLEEPSYILWLHEKEIVSFPEDLIIEAEEEHLQELEADSSWRSEKLNLFHRGD